MRLGLRQLDTLPQTMPGLRGDRAYMSNPKTQSKLDIVKEKAIQVGLYFDLMTVFRRVSSPLFGKVTYTTRVRRTTTRNPGVPLPSIQKAASEAGMPAPIHAQVHITLRVAPRPESQL